jgi:hypothetical protein
MYGKIYSVFPRDVACVLELLWLPVLANILLMDIFYDTG